MSERPTLTVRQAAKATRVSMRTIRRRLSAGEFPNATQDTSDRLMPWRIPVDDLLAAGMTLYAPTPADEDEPAPQVQHEQRDELDVLRAEVAEWRRRAEVAEAIADERAARIEDLGVALRALAAGSPIEDEDAGQRRRRWGRR